MNTLKLGIVALMVPLVAVLSAAFQPEPEPAEAAGPTHVMSFNRVLCTALGVAFGGIRDVDSLNLCQSTSGLQNQANFQRYTTCLRSVCSNEPVRPTPEDWAPLDALDADQTHLSATQGLYIFAFVDDDFPVQFHTTMGSFTDGSGNPLGDEWVCNTGTPEAMQSGTGDPDCDNDLSTVGDGVVVAQLQATDSEPQDGTVTVVQEGIGFPVPVHFVGTPRKIVVEPLFGKDTISTGATAPTTSNEAPDETDCNFEASVNAVIGAVNQAEKTVVIVKVLDKEDNEIAGSLVNFTHPPSNPTDQGMVTLPTAPMVNTGVLGIGFPQFVCGLDAPGDFTSTITMSTIGDNEPSPEFLADIVTEFTIHVLNPASTIALAASPAAIDCNGTNTSTVTATVTNEDGEVVANGLDVNFSVLTLGTNAPLKADTAAGVASTVVTPLSLANIEGSGASGVTVIASARGDRSGSFVTATNEDFEVVQSSILVACTGAAGAAAAPPAPGAGPGAPAAGGGRPTGVIRGPDTGSAGDAAGTGALSWWPAAGLLVAAIALAGARYAVRRAR